MPNQFEHNVIGHLHWPGTFGHSIMMLALCNPLLHESHLKMLRFVTSSLIVSLGFPNISTHIYLTRCPNLKRSI